MQEKHLYEYAVIRYVPRVEREEFINVGVILFCKRSGFIGVRYQLDKDKILRLAPEADLEFLQSNLEALEKIAAGAPDGGPIAVLPPPERFRWLTAVRSASVQTSRPHPGFAADLDAALDRLFRELVL